MAAETDPAEPELDHPEVTMPLKPTRDPGDLPLRSIYIYLTNECNQSCPHCWINPTREGRYEREPPELEDYYRFIDAALPLGLTYVKLTGGEPLLRRETYPLIEYARGTGVCVGLETNAMLVGRREAEFLRRHEVNVSVSLDGGSPAAHDRRRGLTGAFERTLRALELLTAAGVPLTVTAAVSRSNLSELPEILDLLRQLPRRARLDLKINPIVPVGRAQKLASRGDTLPPHELQELVQWVGDELIPRYCRQGIGIVLQLELAFFPIDSLARGMGSIGVGHCGFLNLISVLADGGITFCGIGYAVPELTMGDIRNPYDLPALWREHPVLCDVRHKVHHALEGVCRDCLFRPTCLGGCRAAALATSGSVAASPPWCQSLYDAGLFPASRLRDRAAAVYAREAPRLERAYRLAQGG